MLQRFFLPQSSFYTYKPILTLHSFIPQSSSHPTSFTHLHFTAYSHTFFHSPIPSLRPATPSPTHPFFTLQAHSNLLSNRFNLSLTHQPILKAPLPTLTSFSSTSHPSSRPHLPTDLSHPHPFNTPAHRLSPPHPRLLGPTPSCLGFMLPWLYLT